MHDPAPKFITPRDPSRPTLGGRQAAFGRVWLGAPFMPAQRRIADVAGELVQDPETGLWRPAYSLVVVTEPRQAGKSHLAMAQIGERCMSVPGFRSWYTAQSGTDARDQFVKFKDEVVKGQPLESVVRTLVGAGREVMKWPNASQLRPHPPTEEKLHGKQSDRNDIDEGWAFTEDEGKLLIQAIGPTQLTRPGAQTFIWSAGGTAASTWLASLVARGRAGDPRICYVEYGIPDDADPEDLDVIAEHHPAYGHTITMESLRSLRDTFADDAPGWARAAGNLWTEVIGGAIPTPEWEAVRWIDPIPADAPVGIGAARGFDTSEVVVAAAAQVDGQVVVEVLDVTPAHGAAGVVGRWAADDALVVDPTGPSASLHDQLERAGKTLQPYTSAAANAAVRELRDGIAHRTIRFRRHQALDDAVKVAALRRTGDGGQLWSRTQSGASIAALEAATNAVRALNHRDQTPDKPAPLIDFGDDAA